MTTYYKIIGKNHSNYPYRVGLNTLKHNNEVFDPTPECTSGGLYFCELEHILGYVGEYGDKLCIISLPDGAQKVKVEDKFKADKIIIEKILPLTEVSTWEFLCLESTANNDEALRWAAGSGHLDVVKFLVESGADIHADDDWPLRWAAGSGHLDVVKFLVESGADIHANNDYALRWAAENGHLDMVKFLVESGADIHAGDDEALRWAAERGHLDVVEYLKGLK